MKVIAIVPAFNEEVVIRDTVRSLKSLEMIDDVIVVNDGSTDRTAQVAREGGARVVSLEKNLGKGDALNYALDSEKYDVVLLIDADLGRSAGEASKLLAPILEDRSDMTIAIFSKTKEKGGFGLVKKLAAWGIKKITSKEMKEPLSGQRAIKEEIIKKIGEFDSGFGIDVGLTIDALKSGFRVTEISTRMFHRHTGRNLKGFTHRGYQFWCVLKAILRRLR